MKNLNGDGGATILSSDTGDIDSWSINEDYKNCNGNAGSDCLGAGMIDAQRAIGEDIFPYIVIEDSLLSVVVGDNDGLINPGETFNLIVTLQNLSGWSNAIDISATLSTDNSNIIV